MKLTLQIERRVLQSLAKIASKDESRYILQGFNVRSLNGYTVITACNGVHLVSVQIGTTREDFNFNLPSHIPPAGSLSSCFIEVDLEAQTATYKQPKCDAVFKLIEGKYPEFQNAVPKEVVGTGKIVFNVSKIGLILSAALAYNLKASVFITPNEKNAAIIALAECPEWFGMLMPINHHPDISIPPWIKTTNT